MSKSIQGVRGIAVAPHALAAQSALAILRDGGNAIEAMVAAAATIAVVYPHMNSIGGDSFWLVAQPKPDGKTVVSGIDGAGAAAAAATLERYAGLSAIPFRGGNAALTVAGTISAWDQALHLSRTQMGGGIGLERLLADAVNYATYGVPVTESQYRNTLTKRAELETVPGFAPVFLPGGQVPQTGALFCQPRLGKTFSRLAQAGLDDFYRGELAHQIARDLQGAGSPITLADLQAHQALLVEPLVLQHSQGRVFNMPPPTQGVVSLTILGLMDRLNSRQFDHLSPEYVHCAVESVKQAFAVRDRHLTDPAHMTFHAQDLLSPEALSAQAAKIDLQAAAPWGQGKGPADTVWLGVIDGEGNAVSMIQSIYHEFGSGVVLPDTGITWQNRGASFSLDPRHINCLVPGKRPFHTLNPALALLSDGRTMVYGNMGGDGQPQSQSAVFTRVVEHGLDPQSAVAAPRWLLGRTWGQSSDSLKLEGRFPASTIEALRARGHEVEVLGDFDEVFGHAGCLIREPSGRLWGGFDPRSDGVVAAF